MPSVVAEFVAWEFFGATATGYLVAYAVTYAASVYLLSSAVESLARKKPGSSNEGRGLEVTITDTGQQGFAIYGFVRCAGVNCVPPLTGGDHGQYLEQVCALTLHECHNIIDCYLDNYLLANQDIAAVSGSSGDGLFNSGGANRYDNAVWIRRYTGTTTQTVDYILNARYPTLWTSDARGRGIAYVALTYDWGEGKVYSGFPQPTFGVAGKKCYDPRVDTGGYGAAPTNTAFARFTSNPALCWADYAMADYGGGVAGSDIDWDAVVAAANICDVPVTIPGESFSTAADGNANISGSVISKTSGITAFDASIRGTTGFTKGTVSAKPNDTTNQMMFGWSSNPTASASYTDLNFGFYFNGLNSRIEIYEDGLSKGTYLSQYDTNVCCKITYDGTYMRYWIDGQCVRTRSVPTANATYYFDSSLAQVGAAMTINVEKRYSFNCRLLIPITPDWRENAKTIIDAMMGRMTWRDGKWVIYAGAFDAPLYTIEKTDWCSIDSIKTVAPRDGGRWNTVRCWYVDPARNWQREECFARRNATYKSADGAEEIAIEMEQPGCTSEYEAQRKAEFLLRQSRNQIGISGQLPPRFRKLRTGDMVAHNFEELGWVSKEFRVRSMELSSDGSVNVALVEEQETDWTDLAASEYNAPSTSLVPDTNPTTPSEAVLSVANVVNGTIRFTIANPVVRPKDTHFKIIRGTVSNNAAVGTAIYDGISQVVDYPASPGSLYYYWSQAYANSHFGPYSPNTTGLSAAAQVTQIFQVHCAATQVFSGAGAINGGVVAEQFFAPASGDASISVTASWRHGVGNIFGTQRISIIFKNGLTSQAASATLIPGGSPSQMQPGMLTAIFSYTAGNSAYVGVNWNASSGANSCQFDSAALRTEFIRL